MDYMEHNWGMGFGWLTTLLLIGIIFYFLKGKKKERSDAQGILDKRYANGGISKEEYQEKSKHLSEYA